MAELFCNSVVFSLFTSHPILIYKPGQMGDIIISPSVDTEVHILNCKSKFLKYVSKYWECNANLEN